VEKVLVQELSPPKVRSVSTDELKTFWSGSMILLTPRGMFGFGFSQAPRLAADTSYVVGRRQEIPMKCVYMDEQCYEFHEDDTEDRCFLCRQNCQKLFTVRQISSMKMVHMCGECMLNNCDEFLLDNTRPWEGRKGKSE
jgi:hypothetical protein